MTFIPVILILSSLLLLGSSRLRVVIGIVASQGWMLGLLPLISHISELNASILLLGLSGIVFKGIVLPALMLKVIKETGIQKDVRPYVSYGASLPAGVLLLAFSAWLTISMRFPLGSALLIISTAMFMMFIGLFLMIARRLAIMQSLAYLVLENGIFALGIGISMEIPLMVELGILLDVFVAVFLMGNLVFHLDKEFQHTEVDGFILTDEPDEPEGEAL